MNRKTVDNCVNVAVLGVPVVLMTMFTALAAMKLAELINVSWLVVFAPLALYAVFLVVLVLLTVFIAIYCVFVVLYRNLSY